MPKISLRLIRKNASITQIVHLLESAGKFNFQLLMIPLSILGLVWTADKSILRLTSDFKHRLSAL